MAGLTLIVLTKNEAPRLGRCLASFQPIVDDILVVDSDSTDETVAIAREYTDRVVSRPWPGRAEQSMFAIEHVGTPWFFHVDADEVSTPELNAAIRAVVDADVAAVDGYTVDRREWFLGRIVRCGLHRDILRLCRTDRATMAAQRAHAAWSVPGTVRPLDPPLLHVVDQPLAELLPKLTHRGLLSAQDYFERGVRTSYAGILWHTVGTFLRHMLLKGGVFDGLPGMVLAGMRSLYCFTRMARLHELWREQDARW